jgi:hypothetical protein
MYTETQELYKCYIPEQNKSLKTSALLAELSSYITRIGRLLLLFPILTNTYN